jgi:hypothetical protein
MFLYTPGPNFISPPPYFPNCWREKDLDLELEQNEGHAGILLEEATRKRHKATAFEK